MDLDSMTITLLIIKLSDCPFNSAGRSLGGLYLDGNWEIPTITLMMAE
jgi:hypothetical protein